LFRLPECGSHLTFKGGTSLSKGWKLIERFSEDIDIVVDRELLKGDLDIEAMRHLSERQRERQVGRLRKACREWVRQILQPALSDRVAQVPGAAFTIRVLTPERTFWEKAMLLHEETYRPADGRTKARLSGHYYDLWCLIRQGIAMRAAQDMELFRRAAEHRELFFRWTWMDYGTLRPGALRLVPSTDRIAEWRTDYDVMRGEMFFGVIPDFEEILREVGEFENEFNRTCGGAVDLPSPESPDRRADAGAPKSQPHQSHPKPDH
jgi:hypothetical protein